MRSDTDDRVHVKHASTTEAIRDLGCAPADSDEAVRDLVAKTGEPIAVVRANIEEDGRK
ncbi:MULTISPECIES: hypothetical protein [Halorubrum]|uniref:hypothetical protein n=1 Tax=Halorubrum TaxID=56688 RepID=UPI0013052E7F|nr:MULTISPECIES: hypothetical protein [Halorubrum]